jgi:hypothetical protein
MTTRADIEVVGNNVVYKGVVSVSLETVQDLSQGYGYDTDQLYEYMARAYEEHVAVRRDSRIADILGDDNKS